MLCLYGRRGLIGFVVGEEQRRVSAFRRQCFVAAVVKCAAVAQQQDEVGLVERLAGAADAFLFDEVARFAQSGGVEDVYRHAVDEDGFAHDVARGARLRGNDGAFFADQRVQQAGFARVWFAGDDEVDAVVHQPPLGALGEQGA